MAAETLDMRQQYLSAETEAGKELAKWIEQEPAGPLRDEIALIKFQLAEACRNGQSVLTRDLATCLNQLEKTRTQQKLTLGELWTAQQAQEFIDKVVRAIGDEMRQHFPSETEVKTGEATGISREDVITSIRDRFNQIIGATKAAAVKAPKRIGNGA